MISDWIIKTLASLIVYIIEWLPTPSWPSWMTTGGCSTPSFTTLPCGGAWVGDKISYVDGWFNVQLALQIIGILSVMWVVSIPWRLLNAGASVATGGGPHSGNKK